MTTDTNKLRIILADEMHPLRTDFDNKQTEDNLADETRPLRPEFYNRHIDRSDRFRILCSKTTRYVVSRLVRNKLRTNFG